MADEEDSVNETDEDDAVGNIAVSSGLGRLVIATTVLGSVVAMLTATVVNVALPALAEDLDASSSAQQWVINSYLLTIASLILIGGTLGDRYGRLRIYRIGVIWFGAASLACAIAPNVEVLIVARLLQGVGGALLTPGSLAIIEAVLRKSDRGRGIGRWSGLIGIAGAVGPLIGGILVDLSWRWVFVVNLPIAALVLVLSVRLPETLDPDARHTPLAIAGSVLTILMLGGSSYALIEGPNSGLSAAVTVSAVIAVVALAALIAIEPGRAGAVVPIELFKDRTFAAANTVTFLIYGGMGFVFFILPLQLQVSAGSSALEAGAAFLPTTLMMMLFSSRAGDFAQRIGPRLPLTVGPLLTAAAIVWLRGVGADASYTIDVFPAATVLGLGLAMTVAPVTSTALRAAPDHRSGAASGANNALSRAGQLIAIAAIPPAAGLTGDALSNAADLDAGYGTALLVAAAVVAAAGVVSAIFLGPVREAEPTTERTHHPCCPVDGAHPHRTATALGRP